MFENHPTCRIWDIWIFQFWHFRNFCPIKSDLSGNTVWLQAFGFQNLAKMDQFWHFNHLWSTQNVNVARFACNVECDFFCDFQTLWCNTSFLVFCFLLRVVTKIITLDLHFLVFFETQSCQQRRQMSADIDTSYIWALQKLL